MTDVIKMNVGVHDYYVYPGTTILNLHLRAMDRCMARENKSS